jgi:hypothetical protein
MSEQLPAVIEHPDHQRTHAYRAGERASVRFPELFAANPRHISRRSAARRCRAGRSTRTHRRQITTSAGLRNRALIGLARGAEGVSAIR